MKQFQLILPAGYEESSLEPTSLFSQQSKAPLAALPVGGTAFPLVSKGQLFIDLRYYSFVDIFTVKIQNKACMFLNCVFILQPKMHFCPKESFR